jgi:hypothetical protein
MIISHPETGRGRPRLQRDVAWMRLSPKNYLTYLPTEAAAAFIHSCPNGVSIAFQVDDDTLQPVLCTITPAVRNGYRLHGDGWLGLPTRNLGVAVTTPGERRRSVEVEEALTDGGIIVTVPFTFRPAIRRLIEAAE